MLVIIIYKLKFEIMGYKQTIDIKGYHGISQEVSNSFLRIPQNGVLFPVNNEKIFTERGYLNFEIVNGKVSQVSKTRRHMVDRAAFDHILDMYSEARDVSEDSYGDGREESFLDNSLLNLLVESGSEIAAGAVALFFGYLDSATAITAGGGGGGGGGGNWGRDDDDDDRWLRKCVRKAIVMAQYSPRKRGLRR